MTTNFSILLFQFILNGELRLVDAKQVVFVEPGRVAGVAGDEVRAIEVDATLLATDEHVRALSHRCGAVNVRRDKRSGAVRGTRMNLKAIIASTNADEGTRRRMRQRAVK